VSVRHLDAIRDALGAAGADALWLHPAVGFRHLTGVQPLAVERPTALVILAGGGLRALAPQMLADELAEITAGPVQAWSDGDGPDAAIARVLDGVARLLVEPDLPTGIAFALRAARPGATPIAADAPLLTDFGCIVGGYHSDITRVHGTATDAEAAEAYAIVQAAHDAVIAGLAPGLPCADADRLARDVIAEAGYGHAFIHRTGHGVGLEIHEEPYLRPGNPAPLETGHVFSVEPGIYVPGRFGVRYENLVHLGPDGPELLNRAPA
jgi:Xaa-Pro aminopeptidase